MKPQSRIYVAGHRGLVGSALIRALQTQDYRNLITRSHAELDLTDPAATAAFFAAEQPEYVFLAAAKVGGIGANNTRPAEFIQVNLAIQNNVIEQAYRSGVKRLLFLGSSCIYPREAPQPIKEEYLLTGPLELTNEPYGIAKIAGIKLCESYNRQYGSDFRSVMPTNLYGPGDNYDLESSHVLPALIRKFDLAKLALAGDWDAIAQNEKVFGPIPADVMQQLREQSTNTAPQLSLWGSGQPRREFLHADDMAAACLHVMQLKAEVLATCTLPQCSHLNIGCGEDVSIAELANLVAEEVGYPGSVAFDPSYPDGTPRKLLDVKRLANLGWQASIPLKQGVKLAIDAYRETARG